MYLVIHHKCSLNRFLLHALGFHYTVSLTYISNRLCVCFLYMVSFSSNTTEYVVYFEVLKASLS